jgi:hypothetical protein
MSVVCRKYNRSSVFALEMCGLIPHRTTSFKNHGMSPRSLSWSVRPGNDMDIQFIVVCVVFILPNKIQLDFHVHSRKIKLRPPASGGAGCTTG